MDNRIGERIHSRRQELNLSLRALAKEVDLTASFLSQLERGQTDPSIKSLRKIADALNVPLLFFLTNDAEANPVVRRDARKRLQLPNSQIVYELLTPGVQRRMELFIVTVDPARGKITQPSSQPTEECILVLEGRLRLEIADKGYELRVGDCIYFDGVSLASISALGDQDARFLCARTPAVF